MFHLKGARKGYSSFFEKYRLWIATSTLIGTIIGAGILGIPYVVAKAGVIYGLAVIILLGLAFVFLNLALGEVILRTKGIHQLTGYAEKYLGSPGKVLMSLSLMINIYGALCAYLIGEGSAWKSLIGGNPLLYSIIFFVAASTVVLMGLKATGRLEMLLIAMLIIVVIAMGVFSWNILDVGSFSLFDSSDILSSLFVPWGVIIFAFMGAPAIPEMREELGSRLRVMKRAIIIGTLVPLFVYLLFTIIVISMVGADRFVLLGPDERMATVALSLYSDPLFSNLATVMAILAMFTSFLSLSHALISMYELDLGINRKVAVLATWGVPLMVLIAGWGSFVSIIGLTGAIAGGIEGLLILAMFYIAKKKGERRPEYKIKIGWWLGSALAALFILAISSVWW